MQKRIKFTGPFKNNVSFDKEQIRKKIIVPTFKQARRIADIYNALIQEFLEEGCPTSAKYFQILIDKERSLYENASIRDRVCDEPQLLLSLFDNCKMAEKAALLEQCNGSTVSSRLLLQCILLFENYDMKYDWILIHVFRIIIKIAAKVCESDECSKESLSQIYYKFGIYLTKHDLEEAIKYLEISFDLAKGADWIDKETANNGRSLHCSTVIANTYASALLQHSKNIFRSDLQKALSQCQKSIVILTGVGIEHNMSIYIKSYLDMAEFQIEAMNYEASLSILENIIKYIRSYAPDNVNYLKFLSQYNHLKGVCLARLQKYDVALVELHESLKIIRQLHMKHEEGMLLLDMAKVYIDRGHSQFRMAESCFRQAKDIFVSLNDIFNTRKSSYLMANLKMHNIQPMLFDLIQNCSTSFCHKHRLRRWKYMCLPFWRNLRFALEDEEREPTKCLLKATEIQAKKGQPASFQRKAPMG